MKNPTGIVRFVTAVSVSSGIVLWFALLLSHSHGDSYAFRPLAMLSFVSAISNLFLIFLVYRRVRSSETGFWYLLHVGALTFWSFAEFMQRISVSVEVATFWRMAAVFGWALMPIPYLLFVLSYVEKQHYSRKLFLQLGFFLVVTGLVYAEFNGSILISKNYALEAWGYDSDTLWAINIFTIWLITVFVASMTLFVREYRKTVNKLKKAQIKLFIISLSIPLVGGVLTDVLLPNVLDINVWPMAAFLTGNAGVLLSYAVYRYGLFNMNPASLSSEIIETLPQPVIGTDVGFEIQFMNDNATKMFGQYAPFVDKTIKDLVGIENFKLIEMSLADTKPGSIIKIDRMPLGLEGGVVIAQAQVSKISQGGQSGYIFALSNITQQVLSMNIIEKEVRTRTQLYNEEKARLLASVNGLRQGFLITDSQHKIMLMNTKAQQMFPQIKISDIESGHVVGNSEAKILEESLGGLKIEEWLASVIRSNHYAEFNGINAGKSVFDVDILPISMGEGAIGAAVLFDDITDRAMLERSKDEFFSIASHELRTPLTAIRGNTSMILDYYGDQLKDPQLKEMVEDIRSSSMRLIEIVNDFLDTSRLEQGRMTFELQDLSLSKIVNKVVKEIGSVASERGNTIKVDPHIADVPLVYADANKLEQVMYNLIGNAMKFTENGNIIIQAAEQATHVKVRVSDSGRGISGDGKKLLFRKFQQTGSSILTRDGTKGTGLGLYISKLILESMHGTIGLEHSEPGVGTAFFFTVPLAKDQQKKSVEKGEIS